LFLFLYEKVFGGVLIYSREKIQEKNHFDINLFLLTKILCFVTSLSTQYFRLIASLLFLLFKFVIFSSLLHIFIFREKKTQFIRYTFLKNSRLVVTYFFRCKQTNYFFLNIKNR